LLHIVPSKTDAELLVPMSPELVTVLLAVQRRAKGNQEQVPLSVRYDPYEKLHGLPFPHLFARRIGARQEVMSPPVVRRILNDVAASADLRDAGIPINFTPHDFRRLFTTEMVSSGLPVHIAATLLGHLNLDTTRQRRCSPKILCTSIRTVEELLQASPMTLGGDMPDGRARGGKRPLRECFCCWRTRRADDCRRPGFGGW
jgi:integrase